MPLLETKGAASAQGFGEFAKTGEAVYIESCFSTWLYTGNGSTQTITNGIDLSGKGGLVWIKSRSDAWSNALCDTARGANKLLLSNGTAAQTTWTDTLDSFNSNGFSLGADSTYYVNKSASTYASWTFRKQAKFFDVVTYTGDGVSGRSISHNLGSVPGCIIVKRTDQAANWAVYHRGVNGGVNPQNYKLLLNLTNAQALDNWWNNTAPTSTAFQVSSDPTVNDGATGATYVAYLFAHDAGGFGLTGTDNVISCGSYTTNGSGNADINLGYEPQWFLTKITSSTGNWTIRDNMRGWGTESGASTSNTLLANSSAAESTGGGGYGITSTGIAVRGINVSQTFIYIAIRRGPMKTPTTGTSVFSPNAVTSSGSNTTVNAGFPVDLSILKLRDFADGARWVDRLRGITSSSTPEIASNSTSAEYTTNDIINAGQTTVQIGPIGTYSCIDWNFRRAPGFFDVVCYTGDGVAGRTVNHNLSVAPELMIVKSRSNALAWSVYAASLGSSLRLLLNTTDASSSGVWNNTAPTSTQFTLASSSTVNFNSYTYVAYLFASCPGVSKVTNFTGTGSLQTIDCGFTGGARLVLIKRTDSTGDWYIWDSARGISSSTDPYLLINSTAAEVTTTNWVDTTSTGFQVTAAAGNNVNINGASYIALAIA